MTSNQHGPYVRGYTRVTMARTAGSGSVTAGGSRNRVPVRNSVKPDSLVIAHQPWRGEYVPGPCTHRPSSHGSRVRLKSVTARIGLGRDR